MLKNLILQAEKKSGQKNLQLRRLYNNHLLHGGGGEDFDTSEKCVPYYGNKSYKPSRKAPPMSADNCKGQIKKGKDGLYASVEKRFYVWEKVKDVSKYEEYKHLYPRSEPTIVASQNGEIDDMKSLLVEAHSKGPHHAASVINMAGNDTRGRWFTPLTAVVSKVKDEYTSDRNHKKRFKMIQYLLTVPGIDVGIGVGEAGWTALHEATYNGAARVLKLLLNHKSCDIHTINQKSVDNGETALDIAVSYYKDWDSTQTKTDRETEFLMKNALTMIKLLKSKGAEAKKANMDYVNKLLK